jgi:hypothetical protein
MCRERENLFVAGLEINATQPRLEVEMPAGSTIQELIDHLEIEIDPEHLFFCIERALRGN